MKPAQVLENEQNEPLSLEEQLVGINAKTAPYPAARSWSGGRRRVLGGGAVESHCYHVMSRTCGGDVFFDDVEKEALRRLLWKMSEEKMPGMNGARLRAMIVDFRDRFYAKTAIFFSGKDARHSVRLFQNDDWIHAGLAACRTLPRHGVEKNRAFQFS